MKVRTAAPADEIPDQPRPSTPRLKPPHASFAPAPNTASSGSSSGCNSLPPVRPATGSSMSSALSISASSGTSKRPTSSSSPRSLGSPTKSSSFSSVQVRETVAAIAAKMDLRGHFLDPIYVAVVGDS